MARVHQPLCQIARIAPSTMGRNILGVPGITLLVHRFTHQRLNRRIREAGPECYCKVTREVKRSRNLISMTQLGEGVGIFEISAGRT